MNNTTEENPQKQQPEEDSTNAGLEEIDNVVSTQDCSSIGLYSLPIKEGLVVKVNEEDLDESDILQNSESLINVYEEPFILQNKESFILPHEEPNILPNEEPNILPNKEPKIPLNETPNILQNEKMNNEQSKESFILPKGEPYSPPLNEESKIEQKEESFLLPHEEPNILPNEEANILPNEEPNILPNKEPKIPLNETPNILQNEKMNNEQSKESFILPKGEPYSPPLNEESKIEQKEESFILPHEEPNILPNEEANILPNEEPNILPNKEPKIPLNEKPNILQNEKTNNEQSKESFILPKGEPYSPPLNEESKIEQKDESFILIKKEPKSPPNDESNILLNKKSFILPNEERGIKRCEESFILPNEEPDIQQCEEPDIPPNVEPALNQNTESNTLLNEEFNIQQSEESTIFQNKESNILPNEKDAINQNVGADIDQNLNLKPCNMENIEYPAIHQLRSRITISVPSKKQKKVKKNKFACQNGVFGHVKNGIPGKIYKTRAELRESGVHLSHFKACYSSEGIYSLILDGKYEFLDTGYRLLYPVVDKNGEIIQPLLNAFSQNRKLNLPVRIVRTAHYPRSSLLRPNLGYRYDGIYQVISVITTIGMLLPHIWLKRLDDDLIQPYNKELDVEKPEIHDSFEELESRLLAKKQIDCLDYKITIKKEIKCENESSEIPLNKIKNEDEICDLSEYESNDDDDYYDDCENDEIAIYVGNEDDPSTNYNANDDYCEVDQSTIYIKENIPVRENFLKEITAEETVIPDNSICDSDSSEQAINNNGNVSHSNMDEGTSNSTDKNYTFENRHFTSGLGDDMNDIHPEIQTNDCSVSRAVRNSYQTDIEAECDPLSLESRMVIPSVSKDNQEFSTPKECMYAKILLNCTQNTEERNSCLCPCKASFAPLFQGKHPDCCCKDNPKEAVMFLENIISKAKEQLACIKRSEKRKSAVKCVRKRKKVKNDDDDDEYKPRKSQNIESQDHNRASTSMGSESSPTKRYLDTRSETLNQNVSPIISPRQTSSHTRSHRKRVRRGVDQHLIDGSSSTHQEADSSEEGFRGFRRRSSINVRNEYKKIISYIARHNRPSSNYHGFRGFQELNEEILNQKRQEIDKIHFVLSSS